MIHVPVSFSFAIPCLALQIVIKSEQMPTGLRSIAADHVNKLLKVNSYHLHRSQSTLDYNLNPLA